MDLAKRAHCPKGANLYAELMAMAREYKPRKTANWLADRLGVSLATGRRYLEQPELIPSTRAEQLLAVIREEDAKAEQRRLRRLHLLEIAEHELRTRADPAAPLGGLFASGRVD